MPRHFKSRPARRPAASSPEAALRHERLQKVLAAQGVGSRRECEELIRQGRVEVDRVVVTELGTRVDPATQELRVDGSVVGARRRVYFMVHKPAGVLCTNYDPSGRTRVVDLVRTPERLFTVGRLDQSSEGLILVTNDGGLAEQLTHPRYGVEKKYLVCVAGSPNPEHLQKLVHGIHLAEGVARVAAVHVKHRHKQSTDLEIVLNEGRNREIRRVLARVGHKVLRLKRVAIANLTLGPLPSGAARELTPEEVSGLRRAVQRARQASRTPGPRPRKGARPRPGAPRPEAGPRPPRDRRHRPRPRPKSAPSQGVILDYEEDDEQ